MKQLTKISSETAPNLLWQPRNAGNTQMDAFRARVNKKYQLELNTYGELYSWSVEHYEKFWEEFFNFSDLKLSSSYTQVVEPKRIDDIPKWFEGAKLNYAENLLEKGNSDHAAVYVASESKTINKLTFGDLRVKVKQFANALIRHNVKPGDRVVGFLTNSEVALVAYLASAAVGAIWSATSPDFGAKSVLERFQQIGPKVLIAIDSILYNGKVHDQLKKLEDIASGLEDVSTIVLCPTGLATQEELDAFVAKVPKTKLAHTFLEECDELDGSFEYAQLPFNHPLCILYSSGTTGAPKCMVHSSGGTLLQHLKEHVLHGDTKSNDVLLYYTTTGWMMYNWMVSALAIGSAIVLYDGAPLLTRLWELVDELDISIFGTSAKWIATNEQQGLKPKVAYKLKHLHTLLSTGSPLSPQSFRYVYNSVKKDILLGSISGGSDIISCFVGQNATIPVYEGEIQARNLGMAVECWGEDGQAIVGKEGELVCLKPFPSMPVYFWNDDGSKYKKAYFDKFPGVWSHGDFCVLNPATGGVQMLGRSDGTLNPNGVRFGSAEIYNLLQSFSQIDDTLCVSQMNLNCDERVVLFVKMSSGHDFGDAIVGKIKNAIRENLSPRHVPAVIMPTDDIPYTMNGKKVEIAIKQIIAGKEVFNTSCIVNPDCLDRYKNIPALESYRNSV